MKRIYTLSAALALLSAGAFAQLQGPKHGLEHAASGDPSRGGGAPANDECAGAVLLTVGTTCTPTDGNSADATESLAPAEDCGEYVSPDAFDVWYSFEATSDYTKIDVAGNGDYDVVFQVLSGTCGDLEAVACQDANYPIPGDVEDVTESLTVPTTIGSTYYVRVYYYSFPVPENLTFSICLTESEGIVVPPNDDCSGAVAEDLAVGSTLTMSGDNTGATLDVDGDISLLLVWHAFTTTECADVTIDYCAAGSEFNSFMSVLSVSCPDFTTNSISGNSDDCTAIFAQLPPGTYLIPVLAGSPMAPSGAYSFTVSASACDAYCAAGSDGCDEFASHVVFGTIDNTSDCGTTYQDFTDQSTSVYQGEPMDITVTNNPDAFYDSDQCTVWCDWNQDSDLEDDGEMYTLTSSDEGATFTGTITPPLGATLGATRMRVRLQYSDEPLPCGNASYGDVEDYTVIVEQGTGVAELQAGDWSIFPNPGNGNFTLSGVRLDGPAAIEVRDMTGRLVFSTNRTLVSGTAVTLELGNGLAAGTYHLALITPAGRTVRPVMVR